MITMYLNRTGEETQEEYQDKKTKKMKTATGKRGFLTVGQDKFHSIERGGGYVTLPEGEFECVMEQQTDPNRRVFRVKEEGEKGHNVQKRKKGHHGKKHQVEYARILIHTGNDPHQVVGCIAPGRTITDDGVGESTKALDQIFKDCGGFLEGRKVLLVVKNDNVQAK